jgi:hypothetical protein
MPALRVKSFSMGEKISNTNNRSTVLTVIIFSLKNLKFSHGATSTCAHEKRKEIVFHVDKRSSYCHAGDKGERQYSSYSFLTLALDGVEWSASRPSYTLPPGERTPVTIE